MNTTLTAPRRHAHPPSTTTTTVVRHVGLLDRLALRAGLALITWSRRTLRSAPSREQSILLHVQERAREQRERDALRTASLVTVRR